MLWEPIRTVEEAEETIKRVAYGFYALGVLGFLDWVRSLAMQGFSQHKLPEDHNQIFILVFLFIMGTGFLIHQLKSRTVACLGAVLWISALLYGIPSLFLLGSAELSGFDNVAKLIALIFAALGTLISIGGLRATFRFHQLKSGEE